MAMCSKQLARVLTCAIIVLVCLFWTCSFVHTGRMLPWVSKVAIQEGNVRYGSNFYAYTMQSIAMLIVGRPEATACSFSCLDAQHSRLCHRTDLTAVTLVCACHVLYNCASHHLSSRALAGLPEHLHSIPLTTINSGAVK